MWQRLAILCRGDSEKIAPWIERPERSWLLCCVFTIAAGCALFGAVIGLWRAPAQAAYTAIKMPLLVFLTCGGNALLNGLLAQILGAGLGFRQSALVILMSFTIMAVVLAALSPVALFISLNAPPFESAGRGTGHSLVLLCDVFFIAYAGTVANRRLRRLLETCCASRDVARRVFWSWLAGNLFLGAQLAWVLRPFIGSPGLAIQFLRDDPLRGNFYEAVFRSLVHLLS